MNPSPSAIYKCGDYLVFMGWYCRRGNLLVDILRPDSDQTVPNSDAVSMRD